MNQQTQATLIMKGNGMGRGGVEGWNCSFYGVFGDSAQQVRDLLKSDWTISEHDDTEYGAEADITEMYYSRVSEIDSLLKAKSTFALNIYLPGIDHFIPEGVLDLYDDLGGESHDGVVGSSGEMIYVSDITQMLQKFSKNLSFSVLTLEEQLADMEGHCFYDSLVKCLSNLEAAKIFFHSLMLSKPKLIVFYADLY